MKHAILATAIALLSFGANAEGMTDKNIYQLKACPEMTRIAGFLQVQASGDVELKIVQSWVDGAAEEGEFGVIDPSLVHTMARHFYNNDYTFEGAMRYGFNTCMESANHG